jgi:hypothetical protein
LPGTTWDCNEVREENMKKEILGKTKEIKKE